MKNKYLSSLLLSHLILAVLVGTVLFATKSRQTVRAPDSMLAGLVVIEFLFLVRYNRTQNMLAKRGACDIILFIWIVILVWELVTLTPFDFDGIRCCSTWHIPWSFYP